MKRQGQTYTTYHQHYFGWFTPRTIERWRKDE
jgi:hypothetical protein